VIVAEHPGIVVDRIARADGFDAGDQLFTKILTNAVPPCRREEVRRVALGN
jgi:hypothetical protein